MNTAEIKLDLFRRLDNMDGPRLEKVYKKILSLIASESTQQNEICSDLKTALDEALESSKLGRVISHEDAMLQSKEKYPNLFS